jgi:hypothetical protein
LTATVVAAEAFPCTAAACKVQISIAQDYWGISKVYVVPDKIGATTTVLGAAALLSALSLF